MQPRITIAWDVDDVLNDLTRQWFERAFLPSNPGRELAYDDITANPPHALLGLSLDTYLESLDAFREAHYDGLAPSPEVLRWFERRGERYHHLAITAAPLATAHHSASWVVRHFGRWIRGFFFIPSPRDGCAAQTYDRSKGETLARLGGVATLVDDSPHNVQGALDRGVDAVLFPRPWNDANKTLPVEFLDSLERHVKEVAS